MKYTKPEILPVASACKAIQGHNKGTTQAFDSLVSAYQTLGAYESDE
jgi:hypothetical protein